MFVTRPPSTHVHHWVNRVWIPITHQTLGRGIITLGDIEHAEDNDTRPTVRRKTAMVRLGSVCVLKPGPPESVTWFSPSPLELRLRR